MSVGLRDILLPAAVMITLVASAVVLSERVLQGRGLETAAAMAAVSADEPAKEKEQEELLNLRSIGIIASAVAGPGFAVWYAWYMTVKRLPEIEAGHKSTIDKMQSDHSLEVKTLIDNFRTDIKCMWDVKRQGDEKLAEAISRLGEKRD